MVTNNNFDQVANVYESTRGYPTQVGQQITGSLRDLFGGERMTAVEFGAGTGLFTQYAVDLFRQYLAVDVSAAMLAKLRDSLGSKAVPMVGDVCHFPFLTQSIDAVLGAKVLRHVGEWQQGLREIKRVLKPDGLFLHAEEAWLEKTQASEVRPKWNEILAEMGYAPNPHPGPTADSTIMAELQATGWTGVQRVVLAQWEAESSLESVISHLEKGAGSSVFHLPEPVLQSSVTRLREWAAERWGDPATKERKLKAVVAVVAKP